MRCCLAAGLFFAYGHPVIGCLFIALAILGA